MFIKPKKALSFIDKSYNQGNKVTNQS